MCAYNVDRLKKQNDFLQAANIKVICIYTSAPLNLKMFSIGEMRSSFLLLSDPKMTAYKAYHIKRSSWGAIVGGFRASRDSNMQGWIKDNIPKVVLSTTRDKLNVIPADFLINEEGIIVDLFQSNIQGKSIPWERIEIFIPKNCRCKCNLKDCLSLTCRNNYEEIRKSFGVYMG